MDQALAAGTAAADIHARLAGWPGLNLVLAPPQAAAPARPAAGPSAADKLFALVDAPADTAAERAQVLAWKDAVLARRREVLALAFADPGFARMEAAWRAVEMLAHRPALGPNGRCTLAVAPVGLQHFDKGLGTLEVLLATESASLVLVDAPLDATPVGVGRMARLAGLAGRFVTPVAAWADKGFFHLRDWRDFDGLPGIPGLLEGPAYIPWRKLRLADAAGSLVLGGSGPPSRRAIRPVRSPRPRPMGAPVWAGRPGRGRGIASAGRSVSAGPGLDVALPAGRSEGGRAQR